MDVDVVLGVLQPVRTLGQVGEAIQDRGEYCLMQVETDLVWTSHQVGQSQIGLEILTFELDQHCLRIVIRIHYSVVFDWVGCDVDLRYEPCFMMIRPKSFMPSLAIHAVRLRLPFVEDLRLDQLETVERMSLMTTNPSTL